MNFTKLYKKFLLEHNGGKARPNVFKISDVQGPIVINAFFGIGDLYDNLEDNIDILGERLPEVFIPIGEEPGGNVICLGNKRALF
ncbi:SMI1/KNR4 family protein [Virgibacillus dakarensis]|uniref:SMI1/KNR4 family protein n=1 Tax=Virgibacillus dakarensis TaxID=1917889 RepID=UPI001E3DE5D7|nr:SMI1/KNR4 family protein [Virgibacillus dakarensis]